MKNLTIEQIQSVIDWMNEYDTLKDTHIPIRFKEHFTEQLDLACVINRACGYYLVRINDSKTLGHEPNNYQPLPHDFAPMYWNGTVFINYDELIWRESELEIKKHDL